jgi:hypothetical protein
MKRVIGHTNVANTANIIFWFPVRLRFGIPSFFCNNLLFRIDLSALGQTPPLLDDFSTSDGSPSQACMKSSFSQTIVEMKAIVAIEFTLKKHFQTRIAGCY